MNVIRLHEAPPAAKPTSGNIQGRKKKNVGSVRVPVHCQLKSKQHRSTGYNQRSNKQKCQMREVCITDWNDSCCPRGKNHHKIKTPRAHTHTHSGTQESKAKASPAFCLLKKGISEQTWELSNLASFSAESQRPQSTGFSVWVIQTPPYIYLILQARPFCNRKNMRKKNLVPLVRGGGKKNKDDTMGRVLNDRTLVVTEKPHNKVEAASFFFFFNKTTVTKRQNAEIENTREKWTSTQTLTWSL